jgi:predicted ATPase
MAHKLDKLSIKGFKSIKALEDFELNDLNILIGANGAGKSNFIDIFRMLKAMMNLNFDAYVVGHGGANDFLYNGQKNTPFITAHFFFGQNEYRFALKITTKETFLIREEEKYIKGDWRIFNRFSPESRLHEVKDEEGMKTKRGVAYYIFDAVSSWTVYHFHDTSSNSPMRTSEIVQDNKYLRSDAANIAPFLLKLKEEHKEHYKQIIDTIRLVTPFFDDFTLEVIKRGEKETVNLAWQQKGSDYPMQPYQLSDGTLRFICLTTALLQPCPPSTIIIDEPELGLHPLAINILSELVQSTLKKTQVIIATQSPAFIDNFSIEDIIIVNRKDGASTFERLKEEDFNVWLEDYSVGELWQKNIISAEASHE